MDYKNTSFETKHSNKLHSSNIAQQSNLKFTELVDEIMKSKNIKPDPYTQLLKSLTYIKNKKYDSSEYKALITKCTQINTIEKQQYPCIKAVYEEIKKEKREAECKMIEKYM